MSAAVAGNKNSLELGWAKWHSHKECVGGKTCEKQSQELQFGKVSQDSLTCNIINTLPVLKHL